MLLPVCFSDIKNLAVGSGAVYVRAVFQDWYRVVL